MSSKPGKAEIAARTERAEEIAAAKEILAAVHEQQLGVRRRKPGRPKRGE